MPKRPNPFGDSSPLQYKTHIGKKDVDRGVKCDIKMQAVYEKTKNLLFQGSKRSHLNHYGDPETTLETDDSMKDPQPTLMPGQMKIDTNGQLCELDSTPCSSCTRTGLVSMDTSDLPSLRDHVTDRTYVSGQLKISSDGGLCSGLSVRSSPKLSTLGFRICQSCNRPSNVGARACSFCDKMTCNNCLQQCCHCHGLYCQICSTINYDEDVERSVCLQCTS